MSKREELLRSQHCTGIDFYVDYTFYTTATTLHNLWPKAQFPVSGIFRAGGILDNKKLLSRNYPFNFSATFSLANKRISARWENSTDWKSALTKIQSCGDGSLCK